MSKFDKVLERVEFAMGIAFDTCHKIYILMDDEQVELMRGYGYDPLYTIGDMTATAMYDTVVEWYEQSCGLRFVEAVSSETGFETLIGQEFTNE